MPMVEWCVRTDPTQTPAQGVSAGIPLGSIRPQTCQTAITDEPSDAASAVFLKLIEVNPDQGPSSSKSREAGIESGGAIYPAKDGALDALLMQ